MNSQWYKYRLFVNYLFKKLRQLLIFHKKKILLIFMLNLIIFGHYFSIEKNRYGVYVIKRGTQKDFFSSLRRADIMPLSNISTVTNQII